MHTTVLGLVIRRLGPCVYSFLKSASVSQSWRRACNDDPLIWRRLTLTLTQWCKLPLLLTRARGQLVEIQLGSGTGLDLHDTSLQNALSQDAGSRLKSLTLHCRLRVQTVAVALSHWGASQLEQIQLSFPHISLGESGVREAVESLEQRLVPAARDSRVQYMGLNIFWCSCCEVLLAHKYWCKCCNMPHLHRTRDCFVCLGCGNRARRAFFCCEGCKGMVCEDERCPQICRNCGLAFCADCWDGGAGSAQSAGSARSAGNWVCADCWMFRESGNWV